MNISPDDFEKIGIDSSAIQSKKEQTTYKINMLRDMFDNGQLLKREEKASTK